VLSEFLLNNSDDLHQWKFESSGIFSSRSTYRAFFVGAVQFEPWKRLWKAWAPNKCKTFVWLAIRNRCWTADRLQKKGDFHILIIVLSATKKMKPPNICSLRASSPGNFWFNILQPLNLTNLVLSHRTISFAEWWRKSSRKVQKQHRKGFNSLVILSAWILWKHGNSCVFHGSTLSIQIALQLSKIISLVASRGS
jgi:hypothetical protein